MHGELFIRIQRLVPVLNSIHSYVEVNQLSISSTGRGSSLKQLRAVIQHWPGREETLDLSVNGQTGSAVDKTSASCTATRGWTLTHSHRYVAVGKQTARLVLFRSHGFRADELVAEVPLDLEVGAKVFKHQAGAFANISMSSL